VRARARDPFGLYPSPEWEPGEPLTAASCRAVFDATEPSTIGIEEELLLVDPWRFDLVPAVEQALTGVDGDRRFVRELREVQLEIVTPVCGTAADAGRELASARRTLVEALGGHVRLLAAGTHPTSAQWGEITSRPRYRQIADEYTWAAQRSLACGLHVHVAVGGSDRSLAVYNTLRSYLPELGALASNSPFFEGRDTGLQSVRPKLNEAFPRAGVPPAFMSWEELAAYVGWGRRGGILGDTGHFWWDLRLHPTHGTIELRVADTQTHVRDAAAIAALFQCLATWLGEQWDASEELPVYPEHLIRENAWRGLRYGIRGHLANLETGEPHPARVRLERLITSLEPTAESLGCSDELVWARTLLAGNGAERQRYVADRDGLGGVVRWLVDQTEQPA
jgi:carboxylate-amine ligase